MPELTKIQTGFIESQGPFHIEDGTTAAPGIAFEGDTDTGLTRSADGEVSVVSNATTRFKTNTNSLHVDFDHPVIQPTLNFDFANTKTLDSRINFRRDSIATYVGTDGLIKTAGVGEPRFDHDPLTGESLGLLIERTRTNIVRSDPSSTGWTNDGNITRTANTSDTKAPDGTYTATKLTSSTGSGTYSQIYASLSQSSGGVQSLWAKKGTHTVIAIYDFSGGGGIRAWFDLNTGEHRCEGGSKVAAGVQSDGNDNNNTTMEQYPDGWYRCIYYESSNMTYAHFRIVDFDSDTKSSSTTADSLYVWGIQAEVGVTYVTSFIPSVGGGTVRESEAVTMYDSNISSWFNESGGTLTFDFNPKLRVPSVDGTRLFKLDSTSITGDTRIDYVVSTSGSYQPYLAYGGTAYYGSPSSIGFTKNTEFKIALTIKENDIVGYINGSQSLNDTTMPMFLPNRFFIGSNGPGGGSALDGYIRNMKYYSRRLSNDYLSYITS